MDPTGRPSLTKILKIEINCAHNTIERGIYILEKEGNAAISIETENLRQQYMHVFLETIQTTRLRDHPKVQQIRAMYAHYMSILPAWQTIYDLNNQTKTSPKTAKKDKNTKPKKDTEIKPNKKKKSQTNTLKKTPSNKVSPKKKTSLTKKPKPSKKNYNK